MRDRPYHIPVMVDEVVSILKPILNDIILDVTVGGGGHFSALIDSCSECLAIGVDRDMEAVSRCNDRFADNVHVRIAHGRMSGVKEILDGLGVKSVNVVLADLGISSHQVDDSERGFSFRSENRLDLRMDATEGVTAGEVLGRMSENEIERILREFGEERFSRRIASAIKNSGEINTAKELEGIIWSSIPAKFRRQKIHPATRTFMALRIMVNDELNELSSFLEDIPRFLAEGSRMVVISYHSLEDRIVKMAFKKMVKSGEYEFLVKGVLKPKYDEIKINRRSRSAKLRAIRRVA